MTEDLAALEAGELEARIDELRGRMRPLEAELAELRAQRDVLLTERRRRERMDRVRTRADARARMRSGELPSVADLIADETEGSFEEFAFSLRTGGEVRLGFPGARAQTVALTDGRQVAHARDVGEAHRYHEAGWELGSPGRPGVRVHFPGTRQERLVEASEVFAKPR